MTLRKYDGYSPSVVSKDAKYSVTASGEVRLVYRLDGRTKELLSTDRHPQLVNVVNAVKVELNGNPGGAFYMNEFGDVLVPDGQGGPCYYAGHYDRTLEFDYNGGTLSAVAPKGLESGADWPGPHPGIPYVLIAGGQDIRYVVRTGTRETTFLLSDDVGSSNARATASRIAAIRGTNGGRFYINERCELFTPVADNGSVRFVYIGHLEDSAWFDAPQGYDRP